MAFSYKCDSVRDSCKFIDQELNIVCIDSQAQELNLHLQSRLPQSGNTSIEETLTNLWYDEYKRRVWVHLVIWDR
jgi:hypothetical protein